MKSIFSIILVISSLCLAETPKQKDINTLLKSYSARLETNKKNPNSTSQEQYLRALAREILIFDYTIKHGTKNGDATEVTLKKQSEINLDFYNNECTLNSAPAECKAYTKKLAEYKKEYKKDYKPQKPVYPKVDLENYKYTMPNGQTYNLKQGKYEETQFQKDLKTRWNGGTGDRDGFGNIRKKIEIGDGAKKIDGSISVDYTCQWSPVWPRKIIHGPGCNTEGSKICIGFVTCNKYGRKIDRLATCSSKLCGDGDALECAKQLGYGSAPPAVQSTDTEDTSVEATNVQQ